MEHDIVALGDLITNFVYTKTNAEGISLYERHPAGTTSNTLAQAACLGAKVALISAIGNDEDGRYLYDFVRNKGFDVSNLKLREDLFTRSVFVYFKENLDRYFVYNGTARTHFELHPEEIDVNIVAKTRVFDFPLPALATDRPIKETLWQLLQVAQKNQVLLAVDANYRGQFIPEQELAAMREGISQAHILKMTREEMAYFIGESDLLRGTEQLLRGNARLIAITLDKDGCFLRSRNAWVYRPTYRVKVRDTTGAGDSFMGSLLYQITREHRDIATYSQEELGRLADFSNACASLSTTRLGSLGSMSLLEEAQVLQRTGELNQPVCAF